MMGTVPPQIPVHDGREALNHAVDNIEALNDRLVEYGLDIGDVIAADYDYMSKVAMGDLPNLSKPPSSTKTVKNTVENTQKQIAAALSSFKEMGIDRNNVNGFRKSVQDAKVVGKKSLATHFSVPPAPEDPLWRESRDWLLKYDPDIHPGVCYSFICIYQSKLCFYFKLKFFQYESYIAFGCI